MINKILCSIGLHKWEVTFNQSPKKEKTCACCDKTKHTTYDMSYGCTYWADGKYWSIKLLIIALVFASCSTTPETITVQGTVIREDNMELGKFANAMTGLWDSHIYMIETDGSIYIAMTPGTSSDPLDLSFTGTFVLGELIAIGNAEEYFGGELETTKTEFRKLISYKDYIK